MTNPFAPLLPTFLILRLPKIDSLSANAMISDEHKLLHDELHHIDTKPSDAQIQSTSTNAASATIPGDHNDLLPRQVLRTPEVRAVAHNLCVLMPCLVPVSLKSIGTRGTVLIRHNCIYKRGFIGSYNTRLPGSMKEFPGYSTFAGRGDSAAPCSRLASRPPAHSHLHQPRDCHGTNR